MTDVAEESGPAPLRNPWDAIEVTVLAEIGWVGARGVGIWTGDLTEGRHIREKWVWLPRSQVGWRYVNGNESREAMVFMPRWLAKDRCLKWVGHDEQQAAE